MMHHCGGASDDIRAAVWARLQARRQWIVALTEADWDLTDALLAAINAQQPRGGPRVRVDCWDLRLVAVDPDSGAACDHGTLRLLSWPRWALAPERLQAVLAQARGCDLPIEALFKAPIIVPVCPADLWHVGEQLKALTAWLRYGEVDDGGCD